MSVRKPKTVKNMESVFKKLLDYLEDDEHDIRCIAKELDLIMGKYYCGEFEATDQTIAGIESSWELLMDEARNDATSRQEISKLFNEMLDDLFSDDFFGTEGQNDPRGDHRG